MHHQAKEEGDPPKLQGEEEGDSNPTGSSGTQSAPSPETTMEGETQLEEEGTPALTPYPNSRLGGSCRLGCLLVALILMLISLLGSWAVVHLILGSRGTTPFRIQASYDRPIEQDATATIDPGFTTTIEPGFTTNCTVDPYPIHNITLQGQYHCNQGPGVPLGQLCDFKMDCPLGDDEGNMCRQFLNGSYCSFEDGECGWQPIAAKGSSWRRVRTIPKKVRPSCPSSSGAMFSVDGGQSKGQQGSALLRSPLFPPPLRNSPCEVRFWMCSGGGQRWALSLWLVENSTGPKEQRRLWHSASEPKTERGWRLIMLPLYGLVDWFWLQFSADNGPGPGSAICLDNISFSMDCFLACEYFIDVLQHT
ncbi:unnamed protein product [Oncorhynchus mykiss]|uniref:MAM domain-containing protein n=1 Tax=Oncorhynchus mykiss TaxID=8022 RepID=A0A060X3W9_ONCMY|nr:unnamed protein product [Oncorhynchus mykiss]